MKAGRHWGLANKCPTCKATPPAKDRQGFKMSGYRKWRWLCVHIASHKPVRLEK